MSIWTSCDFWEGEKRKQKMDIALWVIGLMISRPQPSIATICPCCPFRTHITSYRPREYSSFSSVQGVGGQVASISHILAGAEPWFFRLADIEMTA